MVTMGAMVTHTRVPAYADALLIVDSNRLRLSGRFNNSEEVSELGTCAQILAILANHPFLPFFVQQLFTHTHRPHHQTDTSSVYGARVPWW